MLQGPDTWLWHLLDTGTDNQVERYNFSTILDLLSACSQRRGFLHDLSPPLHATLALSLWSAHRGPRLSFWDTHMAWLSSRLWRKGGEQALTAPTSSAFDARLTVRLPPPPPPPPVRPADMALRSAQLSAAVRVPARLSSSTAVGGGHPYNDSADSLYAF